MQEKRKDAEFKKQLSEEGYKFFIFLDRNAVFFIFVFVLRHFWGTLEHNYQFQKGH